MSNIRKAVWSHPARDFAAGADSVKAMVGRLAGAGFDLIIPCVKNTTGLASYRSEHAHVEPVFQDWDPLEALAAEAKQAGIDVHPWLCVFPEGKRSALVEKRPELQAISRSGDPLPWACPARDENQEYELALYREIIDRYDVSGVHLDYIRHNSGDMCFCQRCREAFKAATDRDPADLRPKDREWVPWIEGRCRHITRFVRALREVGGKAGREVSAAVFTDYPQCLHGVGQDWEAWAKEGLVDYIFPMTYTNSAALARKQTRNHVAILAGACPLWEGLGKGSSASTLTTEMLMDQVRAVTEEGAQGIVIFHYAAIEDPDLEALAKL